jgi:hypothetical protein
MLQIDNSVAKKILNFLREFSRNVLKGLEDLVFHSCEELKDTLCGLLVYMRMEDATVLSDRLIYKIKEVFLSWFRNSELQKSIFNLLAEQQSNFSKICFGVNFIFFIFI